MTTSSRWSITASGGAVQGKEMIHQKIEAYFDTFKEGTRFKSWEHCYSFFRNVGSSGITAQREQAALQLGFYLASWGMYRGPSFLLRHDYKVHLPVVDCLISSRFAPLWEREFGSEPDDAELVPIILEAKEAVFDAYKKEAHPPTPILVTKVMLGTFACLPAVDRFFIAGFRHEGLGYSRLNAEFLAKLLAFCCSHLTELRSAQATITKEKGAHYPLMKLVDMYFWQVGKETGVQSDDQGI
jgi:hypothetical protein